MMKKIFLITLLLPFLSFQTGKMTKVKLTDGISCMLPDNFYPMSGGDVILRLPSARKSLAAYTDESRLSDFSLNVAASQWAANDISIAKDFYKASIINLYDKVEMTKEEISTINKKQFAVFEFVSLIEGDGLSKKRIRKYSYVQYTIHKGQTLVFSFNSPVQLKDKWKDQVAEIMNSVKIN